MLVPRKLSTPGSIQPVSEVSTHISTRKEQFKEELSSYTRLILTNEEIVDFDLLSFWKLRSKSYTLLSKFTRVIHCIPSSSMEIERVCSRAGLVLTDRRSRMNNCNLKANLFQFRKKFASAIRAQGPVN